MYCQIEHNKIKYSLELNKRALTPRVELEISAYLKVQHYAVNLRRRIERNTPEIVQNNNLKNKLVAETIKLESDIKFYKIQQAKENSKEVSEKIFELSEHLGEAVAGIHEVNSIIEEVLNLNKEYLDAAYVVNNAMIEPRHYKTIINAVYDLPSELKEALEKEELSGESVRALCLFFYTNEPLLGLGLTKRVA